MSAVQPLRMHVALEHLQLVAPFRISGYTFTKVPVAVVTLREGEKFGRGEASGVYYLEDTPERIVKTLDENRSVIEAGLDRKQLQQLLPAGGARNAVDCALWELEARRAGRPVWQLAGLQQVTPRLTTFTLSADDPAAVARAATALPHARALKLKLDGDLETDKARVRAVRERRGEVWLGVDANQGYTFATLERLMPTLIDAQVQLLEQPLPRGREAELERFECPIPLAADESLQDLPGLDDLMGRFDVVNIKLDKCGGLTAALSIAHEARRRGLEVMVGNMVGSSLAMAPSFVIAQLCDYVDLDGPAFLAQDRSPGVTYRDGHIYCGDDVWGGGK